MKRGKKKHWIYPVAICRVDDDLVQRIRGEEGVAELARSLCMAILIGTAVYGFGFGIWHSSIQALLSAVKMPVMILAVTVSSALINFMLAQVLGSGLSFKQVCLCALLSFSITSIMLCAMTPILFFLSTQCPAQHDEDAINGYRVLLVLNTVVVGICGVAGNIKLYQLLVRLIGSGTVAFKVLVSWIFVSGLIGCELSWVLSPFLARPDIPLPLYNPNAFSSNFFEYLYMASNGRL